VNPSETAVLFAEPSANPKVDREKTLSVMFGASAVFSLLSDSHSIISRQCIIFIYTLVMVETFGVPQLAMVNQAVLSLLSSGGRRTGPLSFAHFKFICYFLFCVIGLVIDLGYSGCRITPVYEFHAIHPSILTSPVGGRVLAQHLQKLLARQGTRM